MKARKINEDLEDILKGKSEEEIQKIIKETGKAPAFYIAKILITEIGQNIKVNFTGAWDLFGPIEHVAITEINRGKGFEDAILVRDKDHGTFIYMPPFKIENMPDEKTLFLFHAGSDTLYINNIDFKKLK